MKDLVVSYFFFLYKLKLVNDRQNANNILFERKKVHSTLSGISDSKYLNTLTFNESRTSSLRFRTCWINEIIQFLVKSKEWIACAWMHDMLYILLGRCRKKHLSPPQFKNII